jgi:hypothetical protein
MRMLNLALAGLFSLSLAAQAAKDKKAAPAPAPKTETKKAEPKAAPAPAASGFVGNKDSKIYHKADCKTAAKMKAENKMSFASKAEAEKAGYKACKVCKAGA